MSADALVVDVGARNVSVSSGVNLSDLVCGDVHDANVGVLFLPQPSAMKQRCIVITDFLYTKVSGLSLGGGVYFYILPGRYLCMELSQVSIQVCS